MSHSIYDAFGIMKLDSPLKDVRNLRDNYRDERVKLATYCADEEGACTNICDFCKHYKDDHEDAEGFAGEGICEAKKIRVDAIDSCDDDFYCNNA